MKLIEEDESTTNEENIGEYVPDSGELIIKRECKLPPDKKKYEVYLTETDTIKVVCDKDILRPTLSVVIVVADESETKARRIFRELDHPVDIQEDTTVILGEGMSYDPEQVRVGFELRLPDQEETEITIVGGKDVKVEGVVGDLDIISPISTTGVSNHKGKRVDIQACEVKLSKVEVSEVTVKSSEEEGSITVNELVSDNLTINRSSLIDMQEVNIENDLIINSANPEIDIRKSKGNIDICGGSSPIRITNTVGEPNMNIKSQGDITISSIRTPNLFIQTQGNVILERTALGGLGNIIHTTDGRVTLGFNHNSNITVRTLCMVQPEASNTYLKLNHLELAGRTTFLVDQFYGLGSYSHSKLTVVNEGRKPFNLIVVD